MKKILSGLSALVLLSFAGCSFGSASTNQHSCADKVVQSMVKGTNVTGAWNCLSPEMQNNLKANGYGDGDQAVTTFGGGDKTYSYAYVGSKDDEVIYEVKLVYNNQPYDIVFVVYVNTKGNVTNVGAAGPYF